MATLSQYAALAEWIYVRNSADQALTLEDIDSRFSDASVTAIPTAVATQAGLTQSIENYYGVGKMGFSNRD